MTIASHRFIIAQDSILKKQTYILNRCLLMHLVKSCLFKITISDLNFIYLRRRHSCSFRKDYLFLSLLSKICLNTFSRPSTDGRRPTRLFYLFNSQSVSILNAFYSQLKDVLTERCFISKYISKP